MTRHALPLCPSAEVSVLLDTAQSSYPVPTAMKWAVLPNQRTFCTAKSAYDQVDVYALYAREHQACVHHERGDHLFESAAVTAS